MERVTFYTRYGVKLILGLVGNDLSNRLKLYFHCTVFFVLYGSLDGKSLSCSTRNEKTEGLTGGSPEMTLMVVWSPIKNYRQLFDCSVFGPLYSR